MENDIINVNLAIDEFAKKGISTILKSRIKYFSSSNIGLSNNNTKADSLSFSLDDSFLEDYSYFNNSFYRIYVLEIYFKEKDFRLLIEKWNFEFNSKEFNDKNQYLKIFSIMNKSIYSLVRILPCYSLFKNHDSSFELEFRIVSHYNKQRYFNEKKFQVENIEINNNINVEYIMVKDIYKEKNIFEQAKNEFIVIENNDNLNKNETRKLSLSQGSIEFGNLSVSNGNNLSFQSDNNEINNILELNKEDNIVKNSNNELNLINKTNNSNESFEFEIIENKTDLINDF
jgi:hypothetical protein